jgi:excisionase family DNA binding protein
MFHVPVKFQTWGIHKMSKVIKPAMTLTRLAEYLDIPKRTFYDMIKDGRFPVDPIKGTDPRRWDVDAVDKWRAKK